MLFRDDHVSPIITYINNLYIGRKLSAQEAEDLCITISELVDKSITESTVSSCISKLRGFKNYSEDPQVISQVIKATFETLGSVIQNEKEKYNENTNNSKWET